MALPNYQAVGTVQASASAITVPWPTHVADDIAILLIETAAQDISTLATDAGFVQLPFSPNNTGTSTTGTRMTAFWCRATSSSMASPVTIDSGNHQIGQIITFRGCLNSGNPWEVYDSGSTTSSGTGFTTGMTVTTTVNDQLIVYLLTHANDQTGAFFSAWSNGSVSNLTERINDSTNAGNGGGIAVVTGEKATAGGTGNITVTTAADVRCTWAALSLKPVAGATVTPTGFGLTASYTAPSVVVSSTVSNPTGQSATVSLGTPVVTGSGTDHEETPTGYGLTASLGTPVVEVVALPSGQSVTASLGTHAETASSSVSPTGYGTTASLGAPVEAVTALPAGQSVTASLGTVSEVVSSTVSPTGLAGTTGLGTPSATGGSLVGVSGYDLTVSLGTPAATSNAVVVSPTGFGLTADLGTPSAGAVDGGATLPVQGEPIGTKWQRRPIRTPRPIQEPEVRQDATVAVHGMALHARVGTTWQVADAAVAPAGFQVYAQTNPAKATGMHNPTDAQIVDWLIQALTESV